MRAFSCPDCGASIKAEVFDAATVECPYCNSSVVVPEELRPAPPEPTTQPRRQEAIQSARPVAFGVFLIISAAIGITFWIVRRIVPSYDQASVSAPGTSSSAVGQPKSAANANIVTPAVALSFGKSGTAAGSFQNAHGLALDGSGNLYVSDETVRIQKYDPTGKLLSTWTTPPRKNSGDTESGPVRLFTDGKGRINTVLGGALLKFDAATGKLLDTIGGADYVEDAALVSGGGLELVTWKSGSSNQVYLDANGDELKRIPNFLDKRVKAHATILVSAFRLALDSRGDTFILYALGTYAGADRYETSPIAVYKFAPDGNYVSKFGLEGSGADQLEMPTAIAIDNQDRVY
ncbi:MAG: hypothetical protein M3362_07260, partial [Acidobacteriota bacterium]|nr:hypothetical protein [Acidobacteriota bacterium]